MSAVECGDRQHIQGAITHKEPKPMPKKKPTAKTAKTKVPTTTEAGLDDVDTLPTRTTPETSRAQSMTDRENTDSQDPEQIARLESDGTDSSPVAQTTSTTPTMLGTSNAQRTPERQDTETTQEKTNSDNADGSTTDTNAKTTPPIDKSTNQDNVGDDLLRAAATVAESPGNAVESVLNARARDGETRKQCWERLRQEGRASGMTRSGAIAYAAEMVDQVWIAPPPVEPIPDPEAIEPEQPSFQQLEKPITEVQDAIAAPIPSDMGVPGLGTLPDSWGKLPANASLQAEIAWVSANRLLVRDGTGVDLARALSPAPSYSALSWLETSILFPSKFADISVKATAQQDDEKESIRREKMAIDEIRGLLAEMLDEPQ